MQVSERGVVGRDGLRFGEGGLAFGLDHEAALGLLLFEGLEVVLVVEEVLIEGEVGLGEFLVEVMGLNEEGLEFVVFDVLNFERDIEHLPIMLVEQELDFFHKCFDKLKPAILLADMCKTEILLVDLDLLN